MEVTYLTLGDILTIQAFLGSVVYAGGVVLLAVLIRRLTVATWTTVLFFVCLFVPLAVGLSIACWFCEPLLVGGDGMVFEFLNVPALIATTVLVPLLILVARVIIGTPQKKESS